MCAVLSLIGDYRFMIRRALQQFAGSLLYFCMCNVLQQTNESTKVVRCFEAVLEADIGGRESIRGVCHVLSGKSVSCARLRPAQTPVQQCNILVKRLSDMGLMAFVLLVAGV
jgi:hypothetical protein